MEEEKKPQPNFLQIVQEVQKTLENRYKAEDHYTTIMQQQMLQTMARLNTSAEELAARTGGMKIDIADDSKKIVQDLLREAERNRRPQKIMLASLALSLLILGASLFGAYHFYSESIKPKAEIAEEISQENQKKGLELVPSLEYSSISNEVRMLREWAKNNPKASKKYADFRAGYLKQHPVAHYETLNGE